jgi:hypothetical protein
MAFSEKFKQRYASLAKRGTSSLKVAPTNQVSKEPTQNKSGTRYSSKFSPADYQTWNRKGKRKVAGKG